MNPLLPPTREFLEELRERARRVGWAIDYEEVSGMLRDWYVKSGFDVPDLEPYPFCETCGQLQPDCECAQK